MSQIRLVVHDIRSTHNVGSLLRTADGLGVEHVYLTGYTPYPATPADGRLPHISAKLTASIHKTALGAETTVDWSHHSNIITLLEELKRDGFRLVALEQAPGAVKLPDFTAPNKLVLILGREVEGIDPAILKLTDDIVEIPMLGAKESFNVVQAAAMALYQCRYLPNHEK